uniref:Replisome organizer n=1 Tax=Siphoviridae sp. ctmP19 TaxID=2825651 RepID=A0A8S5PHN4_9CAUD|nr:MAG TPA: replisome organizer [Siphoviridae sp. ctmP19]
MENSWIRLHRKLMDDPLYFAEPFSKMQAWIDLLLLANFADRVTFIRGNRVTIKRGQVAYSREWFSGRWRWSRGKIDRFLDMLERENMIGRQKSAVITCISILNYDTYQDNGSTDRSVNRSADRPANRSADRSADRSAEIEPNTLIINTYEHDFNLDGSADRSADGTTDETTESTTDGTQHNNIYINTHTKEKNKIKKESATEFVRPSTAEVAAYMAAQGTPIDARRFVDYYNSVGWCIGTRPMADWKAAARMWARTDQVRAAEAAKKEAERRQREAEREKARAERPQIIIQKTERYENGTNPTAAPATNSTPPPGGWRTRERDDERAERDRRFANYLARLAAETADDGGSPGL